MKNEDIRKLWEEFLEKYINLFKTNYEIWIDNLIKLEEYLNNNFKLPSRNHKDETIKSLGEWIKTQKQNYKNNKNNMKNEELKQKWEEFTEKYKEYF